MPAGDAPRRPCGFPCRRAADGRPAVRCPAQAAARRPTRMQAAWASGTRPVRAISAEHRDSPRRSAFAMLKHSSDRVRSSRSGSRCSCASTTVTPLDRRTTSPRCGRRRRRCRRAAATSPPAARRTPRRRRSPRGCSPGSPGRPAASSDRSTPLRRHADARAGAADAAILDGGRTHVGIAFDAERHDPAGETRRSAPRSAGRRRWRRAASTRWRRRRSRPSRRRSRRAEAKKPRCASPTFVHTRTSGSATRTSVLISPT